MAYDDSYHLDRIRSHLDRNRSHLRDRPLGMPVNYLDLMIGMGRLVVTLSGTIPLAGHPEASNGES